MTMASAPPPPFPAPPGYVWDPLKKRFFKRDPKLLKVASDDAPQKQQHESSKKKGKRRRLDDELFDGDGQDVAQFSSAFGGASNNLASLRLEASRGTFDGQHGPRQALRTAYRV